MVIAKEQLDALDDLLIDESYLAYAEERISGAGFVGGRELVVLGEDFPPPPGCRDVRPEHLWFTGESVCVSLRRMVDVRTLVPAEQRMADELITTAHLPAYWPVRITRTTGPVPGTYWVTVTSEPWIVGSTAASNEQRVADYIGHDPMFDSPVVYHWSGQDYAEQAGAWLDSVIRRADVSRIDQVLEDWERFGDAASVTFNASTGDYPV